MESMYNKIKLVQVIVSYKCNKDCSYCYAKGLTNDFKDMNIENFSQIITWLKRNNLNMLNLIGGEPTIHPQISQFIKMASNERFNINVFSNGLFSTKNREIFDKVKSFIINYNTKEHYTQEEYKLLHKNLEWLIKRKIQITLAFNINPNMNSCKHIIEVCKKYKIRQINMDFIMPNSFKSNEFFKSQDFRSKKDLILKFIKELSNLGPKLRISRPLPRCMFSREELNKLKKEKVIYFKCGTGKSILAINPDLTVFPCLSLFFPGPKITSFKSIKEYQNFYTRTIYQLKKQYLYDKCKSCIYHTRNDCQGSCLCYKLKEFNIYNNKDFIIYSQYPKNEIKEFISSVKKAIEKLNNIFGNIPKMKKIRIYLVNNKRDLIAFSGQTSYPSWVKGFASRKNKYFQVGANPHKRIVHEICHLFINQLKKRRIPDWLSEGFCEYANFKNERNRELTKLKKYKNLIPFKDLSYCGPQKFFKYDKNPLDNNICYKQSYSFVGYLIKKFGEKAVIQLIKDDEEIFDKSFEKIFKERFSFEEEKWKATLQ